MLNEDLDSYPRIDLDLIEELKFALEDGLPDLFRIFLDDAPKRVDIIKKAIAEENYNEVRKAGHTLSGGGATFGAGKLAKLCEKISIACKNNCDKDTLLDIVANLEKELHELSKELVVILNELEG